MSRFTRFFDVRSVIIAGIGLLLAGLLYIPADMIISSRPWNDFLPRYIGCEAMLQEGKNPYSEEVRTDIMSLNPEDNVEQRFSYPAHLCFVMLPFWIIPYELGARLWVVASFFFAGAAVFMTASWFKHPLRNWQLALLMFVVVMGFRFSIITIVLAQFTLFVMFLTLVAIQALWKEQKWLATLALVGLSIRPDGFIIMTVLGLMALYRRQWQPVVQTIIIGLVMWAGTHLVIQGGELWELQFISDIRDYTDYNPTMLYLPDFFGLAGSLVVAACALLIAYLFWRIRHFKPRSFYVAGGSIALLIPLILTPQTNPYTLVYMIPGALWLLHRHWHSRAAWVIWVISMSILPWQWQPMVLTWVAIYSRIVYPIGLLLLIALEIFRIDRQQDDRSPEPDRNPAQPAGASSD
jgi:hypothetical protein